MKDPENDNDDVVMKSYVNDEEIDINALELSMTAPDYSQPIGNTPLIWGIEFCRINKSLLLLQFAKENPNKDLDLNVKNNYRETSNTALTLALAKGWHHVDNHSRCKLELNLIIKKLIESGADIHISNSAGDTPLHIAVMRRDIEAVKFLLQQNANTRIHNKYGETPIQMLEKKDKEITPYLKKYARKYTPVIIDHEKDNTIRNLLNSFNSANILEFVKQILNDYTKGNNSLFRFFTGHWNRHHVPEVHAIVEQIENDTVNDVIIKLRSIDLINQNGCLARRIRRIEDEYDLSINKNNMRAST